MRFISLLAALFAVILFATLIVLFIQPSELLLSKLSISDTTQDLGDVSTEGITEVNFTVINSSNRSLRIVGANMQCLGKICQKPKVDAIVVIPAHSEVHHVRLISFGAPGPFDLPMSIFVEDVTGLRTIELRITGVGIAPAKPPQQ